MKFLPFGFGALLLGMFWVATAAPFEWSAQTRGDTLVVTAKVAPEHYFYNGTLEFALTGADGTALKLAEAPKPLAYQDEFFGATEIYPAGTWIWKFSGTPPFRGSVDYQGCRKASDGQAALCFMPETVTLAGGETPAAAIAGKLADLPADIENFQVIRQVNGVLDESEFIGFLRGDNPAGLGGDWSAEGFWWIILLTLIGGIGLNLTPCVLPMIPINLAIIGADGSSRRTGFQRGLAYGIGMAAAYGTLGIVVVLTGAKFGALNASSWFNFTIAGIFLVLAMAMFGVFNLDVSRFSGGVSAKKIRGGKTVAALVLGAVAALLAGACVAPVVISVLLLAAKLYQEGNPAALGLPLLLGVGMALPWPLAGAGLGVLPKPGRFMMIVKNVFGIFIVLAALYYGWLGYELLPGKFNPEQEVARLEQAFVQARRENKPVLIDFWATWCKNCKSMERNVFPRPEVQKAMSPYVVVKFQAEDLKAPAVRQLLDRYNVPGLPAFVILKGAPPAF